MADEHLGTDIATRWTSAGPGFDPAFTRVTGRRAVANAIARRLMTPAGSLSWAPNVGFDVRALLNDSLTEGRLLSIASGIEAECEKDERIARAVVTATYDAATFALTVEIVLDLSDATTFRLVLAGSAVTVEILRVT